jgi:hypothetical protein
LNKSSCIAFFSICLVTSVTSYGTGPEQVVSLTKPADVRDASSMDQAIVRLSNRVMECVQRKLAPDNECFCRYPQELSQVKKTYEGTIKHHPEWRNKTVSYAHEGRTIAVSIGGISRQLEVKCSQSR